MKYNDKQIGMSSFVLSVLLHVVFFIQYSSATTNNSSQAQAPVQDKRISLNLLKPVKPKIQQEIKPKQIKKKKLKQKKPRKKLIEKKKNSQSYSRLWPGKLTRKLSGIKKS